MTPEQIQAWAREAGLQLDVMVERYPVLNGQLQAFAALVRADLEAALSVATSDALRNAKIAVNFKAERDALKAENAGWKADQKENLANQCDMQAEINALKAEVERLNQQCKLYDAAAFKAQIEARTLVEAAEADAAQVRSDRASLYQQWDNTFGERSFGEVVAEVESLRADAARWVKLCELVNTDQATVVFMGKVDTIHTGIEICDSGDLHDEIDAAMKGTT